MITKALTAGIAGSVAMDLVYAATTLAGKHHEPDNVDEETDAICAVVRRLAPESPVRVWREQPRASGRAIHYAFGCVFALAYDVLRTRVPALAAANGALYGVAVWLLSDRALIPAGRGAAAARYPADERAIALASHLAFAACLAAVYARE